MKTAALITGASGGIGAEFARIAARDGHNVIMVARNRKRLRSMLHELQQRHPDQTFVALPADLSHPAAADKLYHKLSKRFEISLLINNAGFGDNRDFVEQDLELYQEMIDLNITTLTTLTHLAARDMDERGNGKILNLASTAGFLPGPYMAVYYATKAYVLSLSEALHQELLPHGVTVTALCPGPTKTDFDDNANAQNTGMFKNKSKLPTAAEVAEYGWKQLHQKKAIAVPGTKNKLTVFALRFTPRQFVRKKIAQVQRPN